MDQNSIQDPHPIHVPVWTRARQWFVALPFKARIVLATFLGAAVLLAIYTAVSSKDSSLRLKVQHGFRSGQLTVMVDGSTVYSGKISGALKKRFGILPDSVQGSVTQVIPVPSGSHRIKVRIESDDATQEDVISGVFPKDGERDLAVSARRSGISLAWQGEDSTLADSSGPSWFGKYAGSLLLTIAGSIASALTGFAIRELPGYMRSRQNAPEKS